MEEDAEKSQGGSAASPAGPRASEERKAVAREAEVSINMVNDYFSPRNRHRVAAEKRDRIRQVAEDLGYQPGGRGTTTDRSEGQLVGYQMLRTWDIGRIDNAVFARLFVALQQEGQRRDMALRTFAAAKTAGSSERSPTERRSENDDGLVRELERLYRDGQINGFIFDDPVKDDIRVRHAQATGIPYVVTGDPVEEDPEAGSLRRPAWAARWPCVDIDDGAGFHDLVTVLYLRGHEKLLHVGFAPDGTYPGLRRRHGAADAARSLGLPIPVHVPVDYNATPMEAITAIRKALFRHPKATGIICDCDRYAMHTLLAVGRGRKIAVAGCDNDSHRLSWPAPWLSLAGRPELRAGAILRVLADRMAASTSTTAVEPQVTYRIPPQIVGLTEQDRRTIKKSGTRLLSVVGDLRQ